MEVAGSECQLLPRSAKDRSGGDGVREKLGETQERYRGASRPFSLSWLNTFENADDDNNGSDRAGG